MRLAHHIAILTIFALAACQDAPPSGQVLARVDGTDITRRDLLVEQVATGVPANADPGVLQPVLLDAVIDRTLLVKEATRRNIDRSPEFLGEYRRARDMLLIEQLRRRIAEDVPWPRPESVDRYLADNAARLADRRWLVVDRITLDDNLAGASIPALADLDAIAAWLRVHQRPYRREIVTIDSLDIPRGHDQALTPGHAPGIVRQDGSVFIDRLLSFRAAPPNRAEAHQLAISQLRMTALRDALSALDMRLRKRARIEKAPKT